MGEPILEHSVTIVDGEGTLYRVITYGEAREDGPAVRYLSAPRDGRYAAHAAAALRRPQYRGHAALWGR